MQNKKMDSLSGCGCKGSICFWQCVLEKRHSSDHSCVGNHVCDEVTMFAMGNHVFQFINILMDIDPKITKLMETLHHMLTTK